MDFAEGMAAMFRGNSWRQDLPRRFPRRGDQLDLGKGGESPLHGRRSGPERSSIHGPRARAADKMDMS